MEEYKKGDEQSEDNSCTVAQFRSKKCATGSESGVPLFLLEAISHLSTLVDSNAPKEEIINDLVSFYSQCKYKCCRAPIDFEFRTNFQVLLNLLQNDDVDICYFALRILTVLYDNYKSYVSGLFDDILITYPISVFSSSKEVGPEYMKGLVKALIAGLSNASVYTGERMEFDINWFHVDVLQESLYISVLHLISELANNAWPMASSLDETLCLVDRLLSSFNKNTDEGEEASRYTVQIFIALIKQDPENINIKWILNTIGDISNFFFNDDSPKYLCIFSSLLVFYSICFKNSKKETAIQIFNGLLSFGELCDLLSSDSDLISIPVLSIINSAISLVPFTLDSDNQRLLEKELFLLDTGKYRVKEMALKFFLEIFNKWDQDICEMLINMKFVEYLVPIFESSIASLCKYSSNIVLSILAHCPDIKDEISITLSDSLDEDLEELYQLRTILEPEE